MIDKDTFNSMDFDDVVDYIESTYDKISVNIQCAAAIEDFCETDDEYDDIMAESEPFCYIQETMDTDDFKAFCWENIISCLGQPDEDALDGTEMENCIENEDSSDGGFFDKLKNFLFLK